MSIDLEHLLKRNKITFLDFIVSNKLDSFELFSQYCNKRKIRLISESEYNKFLKLFNKESDANKKNAKKASTTRKTSTTQTKAKRRTRSKKVSNT